MALPTTRNGAIALTGLSARSLKSTFLVSNIHCASCVAYIDEVLSGIAGVIKVDVSVLTHEVRVMHIAGVEPPDLAKALIDASFDVHHATSYEPKGSVVADFDTTAWLPRDSIFAAGPSQQQPGAAHAATLAPGNRHIENCDACRQEELERLAAEADLSDGNLRYQASADSSTDPSNDKVAGRVSQRPVPGSSTEDVASQSPSPANGSLQSPEEKFNARVSIGGMSCASCANSITNEVKQLDFVQNITVNLLTNSAAVIFSGPRANAGKIVEQIEDIGFEASLDEVQSLTVPPKRKGPTPTYVAEIAISGMTCGSCSGAVTRGLEELPFVVEVSINLLTHSGRVEFQDRNNIDAIVEKIEDLGYDASINSVSPKGASQESEIVEERTVSVHVDGMFCHHCPEKIFKSVEGLPNVKVQGALSVKNPILTVTYTPEPPSLTVRTILQTISKSHESFTATVYHPPSVEDRSRAMQRHERRRLLTRFIFVLAVAIPTFLLGIVFMTLVSSNNPTRKYLEEPMWAGDASRLEWALFIMTTPVMFYGADIFHARAMKEIYSLWRPGSRVPILRRFYRFGSMNLLISAGTMVAYVSSLAVLIMDASMGPSSSTHSSTYFDTVVFLTMFILAGRFMEAYSKAKTGDAVASLGKLRPSEALLKVSESVAGGAETGADTKDGGYQRISVDMLEIGDVVSIPHGASPPADGVVVRTGSYQFDESSLTGESKPVHKSAGDPVYTGSVNMGQPVDVKVTALGSSSMLDQIISVVREGQSRRAPLERVADLLTSHFVPTITLIAILTFVIWLSLGLSGTLPEDYLDVSRGGWTFWSLEFAIAVFVVACPCGLALAAPTALFVGGGLAARQGILVKGGGEAFQEASRLDAIVFDKTGTLTEGGSLQVSDHEELITDPDLMSIAWTVTRKLEESSNHPIARAIANFCREKPYAQVSSVDEIEEISGQGMKGTFTITTRSPSGTEHHHHHQQQQQQQFEAAIGNQRLLHALTNTNPDDPSLTDLTNRLTQHQTAGKSTAILLLRSLTPNNTNNTKNPFTPALLFAITDTVRPSAARIIHALHRRQISVYMCTGDNRTTALAVASQLGIPPTHVQANVTPAGKASFIRSIQNPASSSSADLESQRSASRKIVAFVGDGINDSPALTAADVSIALATGSDVAINSASFILLHADLAAILQLVRLSRRVFRRVKWNFAWALVYNCCLVPVAAGVFYPLVSGRKHPAPGAVVATHWRLSPVWASLAMALSSISVVCSSLALAGEWRWTVRRDRRAGRA
ncbi:putative copper resistance-associated P-type ATPase [Aspergillus japonicus CBS 114.51]|uniref:Putative copper resistance-associated P-type ATPase n=1 Tax=Aspergillus japonicus CBS 114.51 TaxID=1448312 RepID=A0A8T8XD29_ASPJA|nr:putative copper resistance-associated P-type ATPase [Aspergillus japonicus CBS 114.51]RAH85302.1 putative copper resistance-associated P-type ATPase [Aspergillus japonicus CBS 114.51]